MKLLLHKRVCVWLESAVTNPKGSVLLHGPAHIGKRSVALEFARRLNCSGCSARTCRSCGLITAMAHPDVITIKPNEKNVIGIDRIHELQHSLVYTNFQKGLTRVVIVCRADVMTVVAQNALLKLLEEPPAGSVIVLTAENTQGLLATILSRCQLIHVPAISTEELGQYLESEYGQTPRSGRHIASLSRGVVGRAIALSAGGAELDRHTEIEQLAHKFASSSLLGRLLMARELSDDVKNNDEVIQAVAQYIRRQVRTKASLEFGESLDALVRFRSRLSANVGKRAAWEALALELTC